MCNVRYVEKKKENHFMLKLGSHPEQSKFHAANLPLRPKINKFLFGCWETVRKGNRKATEKLKINPKWKFSIIFVANCNESNIGNNINAILLFMVIWHEILYSQGFVPILSLFISN